LLPALLLAPAPRINPSVDPLSVEVEASLASAIEVPERALGPGAKAQDADEEVEVGRSNSGGDLHVADELRQATRPQPATQVGGEHGDLGADKTLGDQGIVFAGGFDSVVSIASFDGDRGRQSPERNLTPEGRADSAK